MKFILDTSAIIALLRDEKGSNIVEKIILNAPGSCCMHSVNYVELYYKMGMRGGPKAAQEAVTHIHSTGVSVTDIGGRNFLHNVGEIKIAYPFLSLGDCYAIGLSEWLNGTVVTSDQRFADAGKITKVKLIRTAG